MVFPHTLLVMRDLLSLYQMRLRHHLRHVQALMLTVLCTAVAEHILVYLLRACDSGAKP